MLRHRRNLGKSKKTEIVSSIFSDHNPMKLEINHKSNRKYTKKDLEAKQHAIKLSIGQQQDQGRNQKIPGNK